MLYVDYVFDLSDSGIMFDNELHLNGQQKKPDQVWGKLPAAWKEGDKFVLKLINDRVVLVKELL